MKFKVSISKVKLIKTYQGIYLKSNKDYKYMVSMLPHDIDINKFDDYIEIDVDSSVYKTQRLYRFDENYIENYKI